MTEENGVASAQVRHCLHCKKIIDPLKGRADRRYCDERCKNAYHNARSSDENGELERVDKILRKNHRILKKLFLLKDHDGISRERLLKEGFDFGYHTHHVLTKIKANEFVFCFGYGYREVRPEHYKVIKAFDQKDE